MAQLPAARLAPQSTFFTNYDHHDLFLSFCILSEPLGSSVHPILTSRASRLLKKDMNTNISPLQPQSPPQVQRLSKDGQDKDASVRYTLKSTFQSLTILMHSVPCPPATEQESTRQTVREFYQARLDSRSRCTFCSGKFNWIVRCHNM